MTHFTPEQTQKIHEAAEKFRTAIAAGQQGQIEDGDSPAKVALMRKLLDDEKYRKEFEQKAIEWLSPAVHADDEDPEMDLEIQIMLDAQKDCKYSHEWADLDPEDGCVHCGFYAK